MADAGWGYVDMGDWLFDLEELGMDRIADLRAALEVISNAAQPATSAEPVGRVFFDDDGEPYAAFYPGKNLVHGGDLYTIHVAAQPQPSGNSGQLPNVMQSNLESGVRPPEIQAAWHAGWDAALEDQRMNPVGRIFAGDGGITYVDIDVDLPEGTQLYAVVRPDGLPVTAEEEDAWRELERRQ